MNSDKIMRMATSILMIVTSSLSIDAYLKNKEKAKRNKIRAARKRGYNPMASIRKVMYRNY